MNLKILALSLLVGLPAAEVGPSEKSIKITVKKSSADAGAVADAGVPAKFDATERRDRLKIMGSIMANEIGSQTDLPTNVKAILFATVYNEANDAAVVIFTIGGHETANFFYWQGGQWRVFPSDFE